MLIGLIASHSSVSPARKPESVYVRYIPCEPTSGQVSLSVWDVIKNRALNVKNTERFVKSGTVDIRLEVSPGNYDVLVVQPGQCTAKSQLTVLADHDRHLLLAGTSVVPFGGPRGSIAGTLPDMALRVSAKCQDAAGREVMYEATVDDRAYYVDNVPTPAKCFMQMQLSSWPSQRITIATPIAVGKYRTNSSFAIRNFDWTDIVNAWRLRS